MNIFHRVKLRFHLWHLFLSTHYIFCFVYLLLWITTHCWRFFRLCVVRLAFFGAYVNKRSTATNENSVGIFSIYLQSSLQTVSHTLHYLGYYSSEIGQKCLLSLKVAEYQTHNSIAAFPLIAHTHEFVYSKGIDICARRSTNQRRATETHETSVYI